MHRTLTFVTYFQHFRFPAECAGILLIYNAFLDVLRKKRLTLINYNNATELLNASFWFVIQFQGPS